MIFWQARVYKAAANKHDVGSLKIGIHFAHAVANPNLGVGLDGGVVAAFLGFEAALLGEFGRQRENARGGAG